MKKWLSIVILGLCVPLVIILGTAVFQNKRYAFISLSVAVLSCIPFVMTFERREQNIARLVLIAALTALSVIGRLVFGAVPGFKPVTAMVIITAMYFGSEAGFLTGALTAVVSNFYFGQGPWTPFQMFAWGFIGLLSGLFAERLKKSKIFLCIFGAAAGVVFSMLMDIWTVLWQDNYFNLRRYAAAVLSSSAFMIIYAVSNVVFLLLLAKPIGIMLERVKTKYGIK